MTDDLRDKPRRSGLADNLRKGARKDMGESEAKAPETLRGDTMSAHELPPLPPPEDEVLIKCDDGTDWFCPAALPYFTETHMHTYGKQCKGMAQANRDAVLELLREARAELLTVRRINELLTVRRINCCDDLIDKIDRALKGTRRKGALYK